jgi:hypothetical protein
MKMFEEVLKLGCRVGLTLPGHGTVRLFAATSVIFFLDKKSDIAKEVPEETHGPSF